MTDHRLYEYKVRNHGFCVNWWSKRIRFVVCGILLGQSVIDQSNKWIWVVGWFNNICIVHSELLVCDWKDAIAKAVLPKLSWRLTSISECANNNCTVCSELVWLEKQDAHSKAVWPYVSWRFTLISGWSNNNCTVCSELVSFEQRDACIKAV